MIALPLNVVDPTIANTTPLADDLYAGVITFSVDEDGVGGGTICLFMNTLCRTVLSISRVRSRSMDIGRKGRGSAESRYPSLSTLAHIRGRLRLRRHHTRS